MLSYKHVVLAILVAFTLACSSGPSGGRRYDGPGPVELHGHFTAKSGTPADVEKTFHEVYYPAISSQAGFKYSNLLTVPNSSGKYVLTLAFESEDLRIRWAQSDLHQEVWPQMTALMSDDAPSSVDAFGIVDLPVAK